MAERVHAPDVGWIAIDAYIADRMIPDDPFAALDANAAAGLPEIDVSAPRGRMPHLFVRMAGARRCSRSGRSRG